MVLFHEYFRKNLFYDVRFCRLRELGYFFELIYQFEKFFFSMELIVAEINTK